MTDVNDRAMRGALELLDMRLSRRVVADLPADVRPTTLGEAYAIQHVLVGELCDEGETPIGYKAACTSEIAQSALGIDGPLFGRLLPHTTSSTGAALPAAGFTHRVVEAEIGFRVGSDVEPSTGGHTHDSIAAHIDAVLPAIEIVDHRFESWTLGAFQIAADNAIHGWWVHGEPLIDWEHLDLAATAVTVRRGAQVVTSGTGANVLGHPLTVMAWLADELPKFGGALRAGDLVTTGVTTEVFEAESDDHLIADFDGIGTVEVRFD